MNRAWKDLEKEVAEYFGGKRNIRVGYHDKKSDVDHPVYSIECKYGKQVPSYLRVTRPTQISEGLAVPSQDAFYDLQKEKLAITGRFIQSSYKGDMAFLFNALKQAAGYSPLKIPVVCVKYPRQRGFTICFPASPKSFLGLVWTSSESSSQ